MTDISQLQALFLAGLAVAGCGGSGKPPEPPPSNTTATTSGTATATTSSSATPVPEAPPEPDAAARAIARGYRAVGDYTKAFPNAEHIAAVTVPIKPPYDCDPSPCNKEWTKLAKDAGGNGAVIRRNGKLEFVLDGEFKEKLGAVDTPEKAAVRLRFYERSKLVAVVAFDHVSSALLAA